MVRFILTIILDANFLMIPEQFGVDIFSQMKKTVERKHKFIIVDAVKRELEKISKKTGSDGKAADLGLKLIEKQEINTLNTDHTHGDDAILEVAEELDEGIVATNDKELKGRCKKNKIPVIYLRGNQLEITGTLK